MAASWILCDIENYYGSAERLFRPELRRTPMIVMSNNDGATVARSAEAKALGIRMGDPVFKIRDRMRRHGIAAVSSNYALYGDLNRRMNQVLAEHCTSTEIYSIDESWGSIPALASGAGDVAAAHRIKADILARVGLPVRIGIAGNRTLSKVANAIAKATEGLFGGIVDLSDPHPRDYLLANWPVGEVWGIGPALTSRLAPLGVRTALDLARLDPRVARDVGTVVLERLVRELGGEDCTDLAPDPPQQKATAVTRSFGDAVTTEAALSEAMARRAAQAAERIRRKGLVASRMIVFVQGDRFANGGSSTSLSLRLAPATNGTSSIVSTATAAVTQMFRQGQRYKRCGVLLEDLTPAEARQADLFATDPPSENELWLAVDNLNRRYGRSTVRTGAEGMGPKSHDTRHADKSPGWTTNINELPIAR